MQGGGSEAPVELRRRELDEVLADFDARGVGLRSRDNLTRDELYDEALNNAPCDYPTPTPSLFSERS